MPADAEAEGANVDRLHKAALLLKVAAVALNVGSKKAAAEAVYEALELARVVYDTGLSVTGD